MTSARSKIVPIAIAFLVMGCTGATPNPSTSVAPSPTSLALAGMPSGCHPAEFQGPTGELVDLTGLWAGSGQLAGPAEQAWLNQLGNCVFGTVLGGTFAGHSGDSSVVNLSGLITSDFEIDVGIVMVYQDAVFSMGEYSTMVLLIEWDDSGRILLREDRRPGEVAGRCSQAALDCPDPVIWYRVDEGPPPI